MAAGPTARTLERLRKHGCIAAVVERWNAYAHIRQDLFNFADIVVLDRVRGITAIQCTTGDHHANRKDKILGEPRALAWLHARGSIQIWSWSKRGGRGKRKLWQVRIEDITLEMMNGNGKAA